MTDLVMIHSRDPDFYMLMSYIMATAGFRASLAVDFDFVASSDISVAIAVLVDTGDDIDDATTFCSDLKTSPLTAHLPILALIRAHTEQGYLALLKAGIDEGFVRPVSPERILSYLRAFSRAATNIEELRTSPSPSLPFGDLQIDERTRLVTCNEGSAQLSPIEFRLLKRLLETPGRVLSRSDLIETAWPPNHYVNARTVDVHIANLRRALDRILGRTIIRTILSNGYVVDITDSDH
ncbi:winged helix-turn-helix transcriptional regulator [Rhizobium giardinii]|uniref:winged helix-turn-helix transcriptional regulator n=1 Tax=Rhizobium giardinii TaxID=56731 RepID=UPI0039E01609